ncbi:uncharacterized protein LAESUDRAFT_742824 [Laetiporus sulphureus 93-53]|uniref:Uncharacterized protein n=1 Tax=Laetiporus sulphureus 93-53 TaxID=1314785 RepID=A0A165ETL5_9APHY|nr:uncharacterized protein LAESUDRAFT_742824 [Laetiporus sulphureus 93-53]KZT07732.1 hypothetical protein LAESUDRAFT_742824 [Laetiporus sulphureus 93-53]
MMDGLTLDKLPVEILYDIQYTALSSSLPLTCKHLYSVFKSAPYTVHAEYLVGRCLAEVERHPRANPVSTVLRYPLCNQNVLHAVLRNPHFPTMNLAHKMMGTELPRRLFRSLAPRSDTNQAEKRKRRSDEGGGWTEGGEPIPFLQYLFSHESIPPPRPDSFDGYALTKAVQVGDIPLVRFLLDHGASPQHKDGLAVKVAIRRQDLRLVRLLIERDDRVRAEKRRGTDSSNLGEGSRQADGSHRAVTGQGSEGDVIPPEYRSVKRRRLEDRIKPTVAMLRMAVQSDARDIVEYLMKVKECVPDMKTVLMIMNGRK